MTFYHGQLRYGLTKKTNLADVPIGFKSKTDPSAAIDQPVNPMKN